MASEVTRREYQLLMERVTKIEGRLRAIEETVKAVDNRLKPQNLLRVIKSEAQLERLKTQQAKEAEKLIQASDLPKPPSA